MLLVMVTLGWSPEKRAGLSEDIPKTAAERNMGGRGDWFCFAVTGWCVGVFCVLVRFCPCEIEHSDHGGKGVTSVHVTVGTWR